MAQLSLSVPHDVKRISPGVALISFATRSRPRSTASFAGRPSAWELDGLPQQPISAVISRATSGYTGVVAFQSR